MKESWHPVAGYEGLYEVSDLGNVKSLRRASVRSNNAGPFTIWLPEKLLTPSLNSRGYKTVSLYKDGRSHTTMVHRLVAHAFIGERPPGQVIRHGKHGKSVNAVYNLCYGTPQDNSNDMINDGNSLKGARHHKARLSEQDALFIMQWPVYYGSISYLCQKFGVQKHVIDCIRSGKTWQHLHDLVDANLAAPSRPAA